MADEFIRMINSILSERVRLVPSYTEWVSTRGATKETAQSWIDTITIPFVSSSEFQKDLDKYMGTPFAQSFADFKDELRTGLKNGLNCSPDDYQNLFEHKTNALFLRAYLDNMKVSIETIATDTRLDGISPMRAVHNSNPKKPIRIVLFSSEGLAQRFEQLGFFLKSKQVAEDFLAAISGGGGTKLDPVAEAAKDFKHDLAAFKQSQYFKPDLLTMAWLEQQRDMGITQLRKFIYNTMTEEDKFAAAYWTEWVTQIDAVWAKEKEEQDREASARNFWGKWGIVIAGVSGGALLLMYGSYVVIRLTIGNIFV